MYRFFSIILCLLPFLLFGQQDQVPDVNEQGPMDMSPLFFLILSLFIGINIKRFLRKVPIPYTVILLVVGLVLGVIDRFEWVKEITFLTNAIYWAGHINPMIILYVFLPTLIFEAAFDLDVHTFKKSFGNAFLLAVPGILIGLCLGAAMAMGLKYLGIGFGDWNWYVALLFGAVICATDPVAVVSILKELGGDKKLRTLIESESLLNDGTAIVIFILFFSIISGNEVDTNPILGFFIVALGGVVIGGLIGLITVYLLKKVFNDPLFEITGIIGSAYLTFYIAEHFFHVSGVIGLVTLGLLMSGRGRTRVTPQVWNFLHDFWVLAAFLANTLIFLIVGIIIAHRTEFKVEDFIDLALVYIGIHIIRAIVIAIFYPIMKKIGYGINRKNATVLWWGGLRGVIGLAMALIFFENQVIIGDLTLLESNTIRDEFLFITSGIVILTSFINATTIKALVNYLGLTKLSPVKSSIISNVNANLRETSKAHLELLKNDRFMSGSNWDKVKNYLPLEWNKDSEILKDDSYYKNALESMRKVLLEKEKLSYWDQFNKGLLGRVAVSKLTGIVNELLDFEGKVSFSHSKYIDQLWITPRYLKEIQHWSFFEKVSQKELFARLNVSYDAAKGLINAQDEILILIKNFKSDKSVTKEELSNLKILEDEVNENKIQGLTFLRNLKIAFPEVYRSIETKHASRSLLNHQQNSVKEMLALGRISKEDANKFLFDIEEKMQELLNQTPSFNLPDSDKLIKEIKWLEELDESKYDNKIFSDIKIFPVNYKISSELTLNKGIFVIARGIANVEKDNIKTDVLKQGDMITEMDKKNKGISIVSITPLTVIYITNESLEFLKLMSPSIKDKLDKA